MCLVYDGFKDLYKVFADGVKLESGSWTGDGAFEQARKGGILFLGQKQGDVGGEFIAKEAWSGKLIFDLDIRGPWYRPQAQQKFLHYSSF